MTPVEPLELAPVPPPVERDPSDPWARYWRMAKIVAGTEMVPPALRDRPEAVFALALYAEAIGIHPATAWQQVAFVQGKPVPSAELQRSLIYKAGHRFDIIEMTNARAVVHGTRTDGSELTVTFTLDDAKRAGLLDKKGSAWTTYPAAMLLARATSQLARALFPDAIGGMSYLAEELDHGRPVPINVTHHQVYPNTVDASGYDPLNPDDTTDRIEADLAHDDPIVDEAQLIPDDDDPGRPF